MASIPLNSYRDVSTDAAFSIAKEKAPTVGKRNVTVDLARLFAAYGVIALHVPFSTSAAEGFNILFWPLCVPFFYAISLTYFVSGLQQASIPDIITKTWRRILLPYLAWTVVYVSLLLAKRLLLGGDSGITFWRVLFYGESAVQLYFLPTLVLLQSITLAIYLIVTPNFTKRTLGTVILVVALGYLAWGDYNDCFGVAATGQVVGIAAFIGSAFWLSPRIHTLTFRPEYIITGIVLIVSAVYLNYYGHTLSILNYPLILPIGGIGLLLLTLCTPTYSLPNWLSILASTSFGIYLSHILFLEAFEFILKATHHANLEYNFVVKLLEVTSIFLMAAALTLIIRKIPICKQLFLGE